MAGRRALDSLEEEGRALVERLGGRWTAGGGLCRCPAHDDRRPSLSVRVGRKTLLFHCFAGCAAADVLRALRAAGRPFAEPLQGAAMPGLSRRRKSGQSLAAALRVWDGARPVAGTAAEHYLESRGLRAVSADLRYHPRTPHGAYPVTCFRPALVAAVRDNSAIVAVHRTFLDPRRNALAPIEEPRRGLGRFGSGAVRLGGISPILGLAEGIETALSAAVLFGFPCWAALGTERFARVALPPCVRRLILFLDNDPGGRRAERLARDALAGAGVELEARYPEAAGADWNDVLLHSAAP